MDDITYLWVAQTVLRKHRRPLKARELVNYGLEDGLFPATGLSRTPQKSMQARLSLDILNNPSSAFVRTSRGKFFLRELLQNYEGAPGGKSQPLKIYTAERREPIASTENVLCLSQGYCSKYLDFQGIDRIGVSDPLMFIRNSDFEYLPRTLAETRNDYKQVITYTVIQHQSKILSFRRGLYNRAASFLRGAHCVGFGGHVTDDDRTLFSVNDLGIRQNAAREIGEELLLPSGRPNIDPHALEYLGIINDNSSDVGVRHFAVVMRYWVEDWSNWRRVSRGEASINRLRWLDTIEDTINLSDFEYWSQLTIRKFYPSSMAMVPGFKIQNRSAFGKPHILCIVGSIGSGKSATSKFFVQRYGYTEINSGNILAKLMGIPPVPESPRHDFQSAAQRFIETTDGPTTLGSRLAHEAEQANTPRVLIDGIRHPQTLEALKSTSQLPVVMLYVYTPPDTAFEMYRDREGHGEQATTLSAFIALYTAPVESQIRYMIGEADIITFNWFGLGAYEQALEQLTEKLNGR
ncbi:DNA mismatch repair protein MutT [Rhodopseudomonas sp. WA056]|uniref:HTH domain-containing protein n=1 Tax=Rhodopseudomonas sp. WA056 TaxID=2269367 RepID=UPI0013DF41CB|nr:DNA mismatch repair protein MutT [Rhodopseudomonas sp. WA056]